jgi:hypothetical protein
MVHDGKITLHDVRAGMTSHNNKLHKFVALPCWYFLIWETEKYDFIVVPSGKTCIPNFIQIHPASELNHANRQKIYSIQCSCMLGREELFSEK